MKTFTLSIFLFLLPLLCLGQQLSVSIDDDINTNRSAREISKVQTVVADFLSEYTRSGSLIDPQQYRISQKSIERFTQLHHPEAQLLTDFLQPTQTVSLQQYIRLARTYYEREGIPFTLEEAIIRSVAFDKNCDCYQVTLDVQKTMQHSYQKGEWVYEEQTLNLRYALELNQKMDQVFIQRTSNAPAIVQSQKAQHLFSLSGGTGFINGALAEGIDVGAPYRLGLSYHYIQPLNFISPSVSFILGVQLNQTQYVSSAQEGVSLIIDESELFNSQTAIEFLTPGEERINSLMLEPQLGLDIQFAENKKRQTGLEILGTARFSLRDRATFVGALAYTETFNERVTVSNVINCGLRDFQGADAIDARYTTELRSFGLGFRLSPYYQFRLGKKSAFRIAIDAQYYFSSIFEPGGRFLGNYNEANNPDTINNPAWNPSNASLLQTIGHDSSSFYVGIRLGISLG